METNTYVKGLTHHFFERKEKKTFETIMTEKVGESIDAKRC